VYLKNAFEANKAGKLEEAASWREVSKWQQLRCENSTKEALLWATGDPKKEKEANSWDQAAAGAYWSAWLLNFSVKARSARKDEESAMWHQASLKTQEASTAWAEAAMAHQGGSMEGGMQKNQEAWDAVRQSCTLVSSYCLQQENKAVKQQFFCKIEKSGMKKLVVKG